MGVISTVDHLVIAVDDLESATHDYGLLFGLEPSWRGSHPSIGTRNTLFKLSNTYVELLHAADASSHPLTSAGSGLAAIAFGTEDIDVAVPALASLGATQPVDGNGEDASTKAVRRWRVSFLDMQKTRGVFLFMIQHGSPASALAPAEPIEGLASPVDSVDHIVLLTSDADGAVDLYRDGLGLDLRLDRGFPDWGSRLCFFRVGSMILEVAQHLADAKPSGADELWGVSYRVDDIYAAQDRCDRAGIEVSEVRPGRREGTKVFTVKSHTHSVATLFLAKDKP